MLLLWKMISILLFLVICCYIGLVCVMWVCRVLNFFLVVVSLNGMWFVFRFNGLYVISVFSGVLLISVCRIFGWDLLKWVGMYMGVFLGDVVILV